MTFSTRHFDPLTPLAPKFPNFDIQILLFRLKHTVADVTHAHVLQNVYTTWVRGVACQKQRHLENRYNVITPPRMVPLENLAADACRLR